VQVWLPTLPAVDGPEEEKVVAVATARVLAEMPGFGPSGGPHAALWGALREALAKKLEAAGAGGSDQQEDEEPDFEEMAVGGGTGPHAHVFVCVWGGGHARAHAHMGGGRACPPPSQPLKAVAHTASLCVAYMSYVQTVTGMDPPRICIDVQGSHADRKPAVW
jgi:hypothetical protein